MIHKKIVLSLSLFIVTYLLLIASVKPASAQWAVSGDNIYNTNTGNVGIGTSIPNYKLHLYKQYGLDEMLSSGDTAYSALNFSSGTASSYIKLFGNNYYAGYYNNSLHIANPNGDVVLQPSGHNVGIGTYSPQQLLHVFNYTGDAKALIESYTTYATAALTLKTDSTGEISMKGSQGSPANELKISNSAGNIDLVPTGNVGIGTNNPVQKLHVVGNVAVMPTDAGQTGYSIISSARRGGSASDSDLGIGDENGRIMTLNNHSAMINTNVTSAAGFANFYVKGTGAGNESSGQPTGTWGAIINNNTNATNYNGLLVKNEWNASSSTVFEAGVDLQGGAYQRKFRVLGDGNADLQGCLRYNGGTLGTCLSDIRLKQNIQPLVFDNALDKLTDLNPVTFQYKADPSVTYPGLVAQQVKEVAPELVETNKDGYMSVKYGQIDWLTVEAIKELKAENDVLKARLDALEKKLSDK